jgi:hypothetical protein
MKVRRFVAAAAALVLLVPANAFGQEANLQAAEGLFQEGLSLLESGNLREACEKFVGSYRLDPANGTLQNVASCHEKEGRTASAWAEWLELAGKAARSGQKEREQVARTRAAELGKELARLELRFTPSPNVATIDVDGRALSSSAWTSPLPLDPGPHELTFKAPGKRNASASITIVARNNAVVDVPMLQDQPVAPQPHAVDPAPSARQADASEHSSSESGQRTTGFIVGGAGIAFLGAGAIFGALAMSEKSSANCNGTVCPTKEAVDHRDSAKTDATISTIGVGVGLVALGVGAYLVLSSGGKTAAAAKAATALPFQPALGPDLRGVRWTLRW